MEELELVLFKEEKEEIQSEWNKDVPIVAKGKVVTVFLNDEIYEPGVYNELCYTLENTKADSVRLHLNNIGGNFYGMLSIIASMKKCNCEITGVISGYVASAATMIALQCDKLEVADYTSWLTHYYSGESGGKGNEIKARHDFESIEIPKVFKELHKDFLTPTEITRVIDGKDMWFNKDQILERFARKVAIK